MRHRLSFRVLSRSAQTTDSCRSVPVAPSKIGQSSSVSLTKEDFVAHLVATCPEVQSIVVEHRDEFNDEVLLHLVIADVLRFAIAAFEAGDREVLKRCLDAVAAGMSGGDDYVQNAVGVSFVEDTPLWDPAMESFIAMWPPALQVEAERQLNS